MENVLSCAAVLARPGHHCTSHSPDVFGVRSDVWRSEDLSSVSCSSSSWFIVNPPPLSSVLTQTDPPKLIIQTHFQNTKKWKWSLHCLNTSSCDGSVGTSGQSHGRWTRITEIRYFLSGGCKYMLSSPFLHPFYLHISHINSIQTFTPLHITILTLQYGTITSHDQAIHWQSPLPFHSWITLPSDGCCRRCWWNGFSVKSWNVTTVKSGL